MPVEGNSFVQTLGIFIVAAGLTALPARWLRLPTIVAYIVAGLVVGPWTGLVTPSREGGDALEVVGDMGIILLMFVVGLELGLERIRQVGKVALAAGIGQVVFTAAGGFGLCLLLRFDWLEATFLATALTFSSTVVVVKLLDQKNELQSLYGRIAVGIFLVQDLVVVVVLTFLAGLGEAGSVHEGGVPLQIATAFGGMFALLVLAFVAARFLLPRMLGWASGAPRTLFMWSLGWCFAYVLGAEALGLSPEIGAFLAGLSIAQLEFAQDLRRRMHPLMSFFVAIFFVSLGARMQMAEAEAYWLEALILSLFVLIGNPLIFMWIIARYGYSERTSFLTSITVAQISEFSFIFAAMGVEAGLVGSPMLAVVTVVGFVTIAASAYMILYNHQLYRAAAKTGLLRVFRASREPDEPPPHDRLRGHVVVVGMNDLGRRVAEALHDRGEVVLTLDTDPRKLARLRCRTMVGDVDYPATLDEAGLADAKLAISALRIEPVNKLFVFRCKAMGVPVAVYAFDGAMAEQLEREAPDRLVESKKESGTQLARELEQIRGPLP